jgi:hypothetical protein
VVGLSVLSTREGMIVTCLSKERKHNLSISFDLKHFSLRLNLTLFFTSHFLAFSCCVKVILVILREDVWKMWESEGIRGIGRIVEYDDKVSL